MKTTWSAEMQKASDEALLGYIDDYYNYQPEVVYAAIAEAEKRKLEIHQDRLRDVKLNVPDPWTKQNAKPAGDWDVYVTIDPNAPALYSQRGIQWCSGLFIPLFGAAMLAANIRRLNKTNGIAEIIILSMLFTGVLIWLSTFIDGAGRGIFIPLNFLGGFFIRTYFWDQYIGRTTLYRKRSVAYPVLIGVILPVVALITFILIDLFS